MEVTNDSPWCSDGCDHDCYRGEEKIAVDGNSVDYGYCPSHLNFATTVQDDDDFFHKRKIARNMVTHSNEMLEKHLIYTGDTSSAVRARKRTIKPEDPMSHRIIEKRRRDRMNNCLADLSRLIPADYLKKGRGRIEKTEIIEMAIKHMRHLQAIISTNRTPVVNDAGSSRQPIVMEHFRLGFLECLSEAMQFLVEIKGLMPRDPFCEQLTSHLHRHCDRILKSDSLNFPRQNHGETTSSSSSSTPPGGSPPLGMSNSTEGHMDEPSDYPNCCSEVDEPYTQRNYSSSSGVESIGARDEGPSQLRDILMTNGRKSDSCDTGINSDEHQMYKFKNNIQQRYNESRLLDDTDEPPVKRIKFEEQQPVLENRLSFGHKALSKPSMHLAPIKPEASDTKPSTPESKPGVPIFALHANGAFYVPLTLEPHTLGQHLPTLTENVPHKSVLHPVTISVNFQQQNLKTQ